MSQLNQKPMRSIWHSLLWKEWHEHKWKLMTLSVSVALLTMKFLDGQPGLVPFAIVAILFCYCILAGLFVGMYTAAGENGHGTMPFLRSLPVSRSKAAAIKLFASWLTVILPVVVVTALSYLYLYSRSIDLWMLGEQVQWPQMSMFRNWGLENWLIATAVGAILTVSSILLWMAATGVNRSDEIRAAAIGFLTTTAVWLCIGGLAYRAEKTDSQSLFACAELLMATAPGGAGLGETIVLGSQLPFAIAAVLGHIGLFVWFLRRFGRDSVSLARSSAGATFSKNLERLAPPKSNQVTAIIWKQLHETGPLAMIAAAAILGITGLALWFNQDSTLPSSPGQTLATITLAVGYLVTVAAGMGVFLEDVKPKIGNFWRSRPVNTTQWFFVKFFTGLTVLVVTFGAIVLLAFMLPNDRPLLHPDHAGVHVIVIALAFVLIYTVSMASYCLGRHPITAIGATLGVLFCGSYAYGVLFSNTRVYWLPIAMLVLTQLLATTLAWLALRNNWGWHK